MKVIHFPASEVHRCVFTSELGAQAGSVGLLRCKCGRLQMYLVPQITVIR